MSAIAIAVTALGAAADDGAPGLVNDNIIDDGTIGYVLTNRYWAVYQTPDGNTECPDGYNTGPREQFKLLYPEDGTPRTELDTRLARESQVWFPDMSEEPYPFHEPQGDIAIGIDLDGRADADDFTSPEGDAGIDNQLYRVLGCVAGYRGPDGAFYHAENIYMQQSGFSRFVFELTGVDDLVNDDDVTLTTYRGLDGLMSDASGKSFIAGGTQRVDGRWGRRYVQRFKGRIEDGVLTTEAADLEIPWSVTFNTNTIQPVMDLRFRLTLTPEGAEGLMGGYVDVNNWIRRLARAHATHHQSYGQVSLPSLFRALNRHADAYPDPVTGTNTAISVAMEVTFSQVYVLHPHQLRGDSPAAAAAE
ncbi:MAG: hypothetical protein RLN70_06675 [Rhodospirillaceae bacterium]